MNWPELIVLGTSRLGQVAPCKVTGCLVPIPPPSWVSKLPTQGPSFLGLPFLRLLLRLRHMLQPGPRDPLLMFPMCSSSSPVTCLFCSLNSFLAIFFLFLLLKCWCFQDSVLGLLPESLWMTSRTKIKIKPKKRKQTEHLGCHYTSFFFHIQHSIYQRVLPIPSSE